jgi:hypothetical protein
MLSDLKPRMDANGREPGRRQKDESLSASRLALRSALSAFETVRRRDRVQMADVRRPSSVIRFAPRAKRLAPRALRFSISAFQHLRSRQSSDVRRPLCALRLPPCAKRFAPCAPRLRLARCIPTF